MEQSENVALYVQIRSAALRNIRHTQSDDAAMAWRVAYDPDKLRTHLTRASTFIAVVKLIPFICRNLPRMKL